MKSYAHPDLEDISLPAMLQALSDPCRIAIVQSLLQGKGAEFACGEIPLKISKATRSHHFKTLREAGVTYTRIEGTHRHVSLRRDDLEARFPGLLDAVLQMQPAPA